MGRMLVGMMLYFRDIPFILQASTRTGRYCCVSAVRAELSQQLLVSWWPEPREGWSLSSKLQMGLGWSSSSLVYFCRNWRTVYKYEKQWVMIYSGKREKAGRAAFTCEYQLFVLFTSRAQFVQNNTVQLNPLPPQQIACVEGILLLNLPSSLAVCVIH